MLRYSDSDVYRFQNNGDVFFKRIVNALNKVGPTTIINDKIISDLELMQKNYKEPIILKILSAIKSKKIILIRIENPLDRLPDMLPFVKVRREGKNSVIVDVSRWCSIETDDDNPNGNKIHVDITKLHDVVVPAYLAYELFGASMVLPFEANRNLALLWAETINQVLSRLGIFGNNPDRRDAYRYFAVKHYLTYYLQCATPVIESISTGILKFGKNELINAMEDNISRLNLSPYENTVDYFQVMFNNEVNGIRGIDQKISNNLNFSEYIKKFTEMYGPEAIGTFYSPEYFLYVLYTAYRKSDIVRDRAFDNIVSVGKGGGVMTKLLQSLYKEV